MDELQAEQSRLCEDKIKLQTELEHVRGDLQRKDRQYADQLSSFERIAMEKTAAMEQLQKEKDEMRAQLESVQQDKEKKL